jgi:hypothetical protein
MEKSTTTAWILASFSIFANGGKNSTHIAEKPGLNPPN